MKQLEAILIDCGAEWDAMFKQLKIPFVSFEGKDAVSDLQKIQYEAPVTFIHLSQDKVGRGEGNIFLQEVFKYLPETTRRILFCNGMDRPTAAKNDAIHSEADILLDGSRLHNDTYEAYVKQIKSPCEIYVEKGYVSPKEIFERGKTVELDNGQREGITTAPERKADERYHPYNDREYIRDVKNREGEK